MKNYTFDEIKKSHEGMLRAKESLISRARIAASRQGLAGKAEFAIMVAALFLYEIWFSLVVYVHLVLKRVFFGKKIPKVAIIVPVFLVFIGIAAFAAGGGSSAKNSGEENAKTEASLMNDGQDVPVDDIAFQEKQKADAAEEAFIQEKAEAESVEETATDVDAKEETVLESEEATEGENTPDEETEEISEGATNAEDSLDDTEPEENADDAIEENTEENAEESAEESADADSESSKYAELKNENSDYYGWITSADAGIDSAVRSSSSRPEKYLDKDFNGKRNKNGLPSIVDEVRGDLSSIIIYAGNTDGNGEFAGLLKYENGDCNGTVRLDMPDESIEFEMVTAFAESEEAKDNEELKHIGDDAKVGDCFLVLVTGTTDGRRFYVVAKSK